MKITMNHARAKITCNAVSGLEVWGFRGFRALGVLGFQGFRGFRGLGVFGVLGVLRFRGVGSRFRAARELAGGSKK